MLGGEGQHDCCRRQGLYRTAGQDGDCGTDAERDVPGVWNGWSHGFNFARPVVRCVVAPSAARSPAIPMPRPPLPSLSGVATRGRREPSRRFAPTPSCPLRITSPARHSVRPSLPSAAVRRARRRARSEGTRLRSILSTQALL